ncbi:hypothetical protein ACFX11_020510 [Malus domestica]
MVSITSTIRYLKVPREDGLEISELAIDDAKSELYHSINRCMKKSEVQRMSSALALMFDVVHSSFHLFVCTISVTYRVARMLVLYCNEDLVRLWGAEPAELGGAWTEVAGSICACHPHPCSCIDPTPTHEDITNLDPESDRLLAN